MPHLFLRALKTNFFIIPAAILGMLLFLAVGFYFTFTHALQTSAQLQQDTIIIFEKGESLRKIARKLHNNKLIKSFFIFEFYVRVNGLGNKLQAGEYLFTKDTNTLQIINKMVRGDVVLHPILIIEGLTSQQILETLRTNELLADNLDIPVPEGTLLPETYHMPRGKKRIDVLNKMRRDHQEFVDRLWETRNRSLPYKTQEEAIILASLIEKETPISHEKPRVSAIFINRLKKGMKLQADPTIIYGLYRQTGEMVKELSKADLSRQNEFNTYIVEGLPPTPICHPGKESIIAAFHPLETDELYFVADGSGGHVFARTYEEHRLNHQNWRRIRDNMSR